MQSQFTLNKVLLRTLLVLFVSTITIYSQDANTLLNHWNVVATDDLLYVSEIEGRTYVGGDYNMNNAHQYGFKLTGNSSSDIVFAVKGNVSTNGQSNIKVFYGSAAIGSNTVDNYFEFKNGGSLNENSSWPANNDPTATLIAAADHIKTLTSNSSVTIPRGQPGPLKFVCAANEEVAIFDITDSELFENSKVQQIELIPDGATKTVIVNVESVDGKIDFNQGNMVGDFNNSYWRSRVLFNVYTNKNNGNMDYINADRNFNGVLLAPTATVKGNSNYDGTVVCENLNNNSEVHYYGWDGEIPPTSSDDCVDNGNDDETTFNGFNFVFNGVSDNGNNTYTYSYTVTGVGASKDLSHWVLALCDDLTSSNIVSASPNTWEVNTDPRTGVYGIKWDESIGKNGGTKTFTFTLDKNYELGLMDVAFKAGTASYYCTITGPTCELNQECKNTIGDKVWHDMDVDGKQDSSEPGIEGVVVNLTGNGQNLSTTTDLDGKYEFTDLPNGTYTIELDASNFQNGGVLNSTDNEKWYYTKRNQGDDTKDSDANSNNSQVSVTLDCNDDSTIDFGFYKTCVTLIKEADKTEATVGDIIYYTFTVTNCGDVKLGGGVDVYDEMLKPGKKLFYTTLEPGQSKTYTEYSNFKFKYVVKDEDCDQVLVNTARAEGHPINGTAYVNATASASVNIVCSPQCTGEIGDYVFVDKTGDCNGSQAGSTPIEGAIVELKYSNVTLYDTTDASGKYLFTALCAGDYDVKIISVPSEYSQHTLSTPNKFDITLATDEAKNLTADFGYCPPVVCEGQIGDYVYVDNTGDCNGDQLGSTPIKGAVVQLKYGTTTVTETTDDNGKYLFTGLCADNYEVTIVSVPAEYSGYTLSTANKFNITLSENNSTNLTADFGYCAPVVCEGQIGDYVFVENSGNCDGDQTGSTPIEGALVELKYGSITLTTNTDANGKYLFEDLCAGDYVVTMLSVPAEYDEYSLSTPNQFNITLAGNNTVNLTADFGYCAPVVGCEGQIGDYVFVDNSDCSGSQVGSTPIEGAIIQLTYGNVRKTAETDASGKYLFTELCNGDYEVAIVSVPAEYDEYTLSTQAVYNVTIDTKDLIYLDADFGYCEPETPETDLRIEKSVNDENPEDGDVISYTIKIYNDGAIEAGDIEVADLLPSGATYQSHIVSQGDYYPLAGSWEVGTLASSATAELTITAQVDVDDVYTTNWDLGPAIGYNVFVLKDIDQPSSDTEGKVAVGRNARFANYSVGDKLENSNGAEDVLIVNKNLTFTSGAVYNGNIVFGNATNLPINQVSITGGVLKNDTPIDFAAAGNYLRALSTDLSYLDTNGTVEYQWGGFTLTGNDPFLNVFEIKGSDLSDANNVSINVQSGSVVLVNVTGNNISWSGGSTVNGIEETKVLYNFPQAQKLTIQGIDVRGSVLAPRASLNFVSGVINGQVIAKNIEGIGQFNNKLFTGHLAGSKCVVNIAEITNSNVEDSKSSNNSDMAIFCVGEGSNNGGTNPGNGGSNPSNGWEYTGEFGIQEIIYSFTYDASGNIYAGTYGGKIYLSEDGGLNWAHINSNMQVAVIWSMVAYDGFVFAATERGIYRFDGSSWTLVGLSGYDVRTITVDLDGNIYAGTWGLGIFKSTDNGITWNAINNGLGYNLVINSITVTTYNEIIVSTVGGGVAVSSNGGVSWEITNASFNLAWTLDVTSDGTIYAGTYGSGLHFSLDGGYTWEVASLGLEAEFIYSISVDVEDNIYVSSLNSGVYVSYDAGVNWESLGLGGYGISSIFVNTYQGLAKSSSSRQSGTTLIAGSKTGQVYTKAISGGSVTDVEDEETLPTEFALEQNYPNPFNPSTTIKFSIPEAGNYNLKIYNAIGQEVATLAKGQMTAGNYSISFEASHLASGMYIYQLLGTNVKITKKMILMK